jgi:hypothetical protein
MSLKDLGQWLFFATVPIVLVLGTLVAIWLTLFIDLENEAQKISLPVFHYQSPERADITQAVDHKRNYTSAGQDIFKIETTLAHQEQELELHQVALGMVIVKDDKRFCLTNGLLYKEGAKGSGFTVHRIETDGVWYQVGSKKIFLQAGQKVNVDGKGNIRE